MARNIKAFARGLPPPKRSSGFAQAGGIVDTPEAFAFANGLGIMGEADPEAILPLTRARSGKLGVRAAMTRAGGDAPQHAYRLAA